MAIESKSLPYAKEVGDVGVALKTLVADIKAKKSLSEIAADALPKVMAAVDGVGDIDDEVAANRGAAIATMGYHTGEIVDALLPS